MFEVIDNLGDGTEFFVRRFFQNGTEREYPIMFTRSHAIKAAGLELSELGTYATTRAGVKVDRHR